MEVEPERRPVGGVVPLEVGHEHLELGLLVVHLGTVVHHGARVLLPVDAAVRSERNKFREEQLTFVINFPKNRVENGR